MLKYAFTPQINELMLHQILVQISAQFEIDSYTPDLSGDKLSDLDFAINQDKSVYNFEISKMNTLIPGNDNKSTRSIRIIIFLNAKLRWRFCLSLNGFLIIQNKSQARVCTYNKMNSSNDRIYQHVSNIDRKKRT